MIPISHPNIGEEEVEAATRVLRSGKLVQGAEVEAFENEWEIEFGHGAVAVSSGTAALTLLLRAHDIGMNDEVIIPSFSFFATAEAVVACGATPVFADIEIGGFTLGAESVRQKVTPRTRAIIAVHLYGQPADMKALGRVATEAKALLLEDACQAHGAVHGLQGVGAFMDGGAFSFYPSKNMTTMEGGMVTSRDPNIRHRVKLLRNHGVAGRAYEHALVSGNYKMTEVQAAIGRVQLRKLKAANEKRIENARYYTDYITARIGMATRVRPPSFMNSRTHVFNQYTVRVDPKVRDTLRDALVEQGIDARVYYPKGIHEQRMFMNMADSSELIETMQATREVLSIPVHPGLTEDSRERIMHALEALA